MATQKASKKKTIIMVSIIAVLLAVIGVLVYMLLKPKEKPLPNVVTENNKDEIRQALEEKVADGMFEMNMTTEWTFDSSSVPSKDALVGNAASNHYTIYFTVTLDDTEELVYTSPNIPVGSQVTEIQLEKDVPAGTYPATLQYHMVDESGGEKSSVGVGIVLNILN